MSWMRLLTKGILHRAPAAACAAALLGAGAPVCAQITQESEPNDTPATATGPLTAGIFVVATIDGAADVDYFSYVVPGAGRVTIGVHGPKGATFSWTLRDSGGTVVGDSDQSRRPETKTLILPASAGGQVHTIEVRRESVTGPPSTVTPYDLAITFLDGSARPTKPGSITNYFLGTSADSPDDPVDGPAMLLMGGGSEVDNAFRHQAYPIINGGNIVVVRASGSSGYQTYLHDTIYASGALKPASVETIIINSVAKANEAYTSWVVARAEMVWFAGGDQSAYVNYYQGTALERAVTMAYNRGAVIGGTSAGAMILGEYVYDPDGVSAVTSAQAVNNPYHPSLHTRLTTDFFRFPIMRNILVETHTQYHPSNPNRLGRLSAFLAYLQTEGLSSKVFGVGPDDGASIFITRHRIGTNEYSSTYPTWILFHTAATQIVRCVSGQTLIYENLRRQLMSPGSASTFDFNDAIAAGGSTIDVTIDNNVYVPSDWYLTLPVTLSGFAAE